MPAYFLPVPMAFSISFKVTFLEGFGRMPFKEVIGTVFMLLE